MSGGLRAGDPERLGDYELIGRLGSGGMGTVFLGRDPSGRRVAVKVIRSEFADDPELRARFGSEVNRARQVPPFSTAAVLHADLEHHPPYLVVEFVDGPTLGDVVRDSGPLTDLHSVAVGIATALAAIHGAGVIHRDLKPGNVMFAFGGIKVIDFGLARALEVTSQHTRTDQMVGTVAYMAPERFEQAGHPVGPAADIFAWGVVLAFAATGRTPFTGDSAPATAMRILSAPPDLSGLTGQIRELVEWSLAKDPADRPTARQLLDALLENGTPSPPPPDAVPPAAYRPSPSSPGPLPAGPRRDRPEKKRRAPARALTVALVVAVLASGSLGWWLHVSGRSATSADDPAAVQEIGAVPGQAVTTPQGMLELLSLLLPNRDITSYNARGSQHEVQVTLDGDGQGDGDDNDVRTAPLTLSVSGPARSTHQGKPKVAIQYSEDNCVQNSLVTATWNDGTQLNLQVSNCDDWNGTTNPKAPRPITDKEAVQVAVDPRWGTTMDAGLISAGAIHFPGIR